MREYINAFLHIGVIEGVCLFICYTFIGKGGQNLNCSTAHHRGRVVRKISAFQELGVLTNPVFKGFPC